MVRRIAVFLGVLAAINGGPAAPFSSGSPASRAGFLGAFFRPEGAPPFGVFSARSRNIAPEPYPKPTKTLFGPNGYCDVVAPNGVSISSGYEIDAKKLADIVGLGVRWTRTPPSPFFDDRSHLAGSPRFAFGDFDSAQCGLLRAHIVPLIALEAGPVQYDAVEGRYSPESRPVYASPADFGAWCGTVARHEVAAFPAVRRYSLPGNEVNTNRELFPGGDAQVASYSKACYRAVKAADVQAFVYGFELNMDAHADPARFVDRMYRLDCKRGTCYDGLAIHLSLTFPTPAAGTPCYPHAGGAYSMRCVDDVRGASRDATRILVSETGYFVPSTVPDEATKAQAIVAAFEAFARDPDIDGVNYANVDECGLYPRGYFSGGCLWISTGGDCRDTQRFGRS